MSDNTVAAEADHLPKPQSWLSRRSASPWVPGSVDQVLPNLHALLSGIKEDSALDRQFIWPATGVRTTLKKAVYAIASGGLTAYAKTLAGGTRRVELTPEGAEYLRSGNDLLLLATLHANVRFVGEALISIGNGVSHSELNEIAAVEYGLTWTTEDQIRRRVYWFRALGLVDLWSNGQIVLADKGRAFCEALTVALPEEMPHRAPVATESVSLPPACPVIETALRRLDQEKLKSRKRRFGYIAGTGIIQSIKIMLDAATPEIGRDKFLSICAERFNINRSSAEQTMHTLRSLDLIGQVGPDSFAPTPTAVGCASVESPVEFVRAIHLSCSMVGEVLTVMDGQIDSATISNRLNSKYPDHRLTRGDVTRRLQLLEEGGLVERMSQTAYRITPLGVSLADHLPLLKPSLENDPVVASTLEEKMLVSSDRLAPYKKAAREVVEASRDGGDYRRLERAVAEAFRMLGSKVQHIGRPGAADVIATFWISPRKHWTLAIDAKADGSGSVREDAVKFNALEEHKRRHKADQSVLVGPGFGGRLPQWAESNGVIIVTAAELADLLLKQSVAPLHPREVAPVFKTDYHGSRNEAWLVAERRQLALSAVAQILWDAGNDPEEVEIGGGALNVREIRQVSKRVSQLALTPEEIERSIGFLSGPFIGGSEAVRLTEHAAAAPPQLIVEKLRALADSIEAAKTAHTPAKSPPESVVQAEKGRTAPRSDQKDTYRVADVRAWAKQQGRNVSDRGRLPAALIADYLSATRGLESRSTIF